MVQCIIPRTCVMLYLKKTNAGAFHLGGKLVLNPIPSQKLDKVAFLRFVYYLAF